jgi:Rho-binding antiterminator
MKESEPYQPISCDLYDHLEIAAMRGSKVRIEYDEGGIEKSRMTTIKTLQVIEHIEYLVTDDDIMIRLDRLSNIYDNKGELLVSFDHKRNC